MKLTSGKKIKMTTSTIISAYIEEQIIESTIESVSEFLEKTFNEGEIIIING
jgi:glycosyltransferase involved in cell wall biosynthesis